MVKNTKYLFQVIWGKRYVGVALDIKLRKNIKYPITTFFFWPNDNGWELLNNQLSIKPYLPEEDKIEILNNYNKIINYWVYNVEKIDDITILMKDSIKYNFEICCIDF
uniref:putative plastid-specific 30S ribosomal protein n=1 Tax=Dictyotopsis propagulifera TaxID=670095 RepID=UPI002E77DA29|nr:putative plastid-specific 30S ribosomal protein [Dictyotopsis propagulifera]WAM63240.1 putative plastid-specific 30S ribosomal protein [Dictyotopsis propagulifera]